MVLQFPVHRPDPLFQAGDSSDRLRHRRTLRIRSETTPLRLTQGRPEQESSDDDNIVPAQHKWQGACRRRLRQKRTLDRIELQNLRSWRASGWQDLPRDNLSPLPSAPGFAEWSGAEGVHLNFSTSIKSAPW